MFLTKGMTTRSAGRQPLVLLQFTIGRRECVCAYYTAKLIFHDIRNISLANIQLLVVALLHHSPIVYLIFDRHRILPTRRVEPEFSAFSDYAKD
jgi:hypothetical protein